MTFYNLLTVTHGADYNSCDADGCMPIHVAAILGAVDIVAYFIAKGQNVDVKDAKGRTPLMLGITKSLFPLTTHNFSALRHGNSIEAVRLLIKLGASMTCVDMEDANTCLHMAILGGKPWMLSTLIKQVGAQNLPWGMTNNQEIVEHRFCRITQVSNFLSCIGVLMLNHHKNQCVDLLGFCYNARKL